MADPNVKAVSTGPQNPFQPVMDLLRGVDRNVVCEKYGLSAAQLEKLFADYQASRRQVALADHLILERVGRNDPCPCGSGKKYKKCCMAIHEEARKSLPKNELLSMEERARRREKLQKDVQKGFDLLVSQEYSKALRLAERLLEEFPEDDRLHDIVTTVHLATGNYDEAFHRARKRWQIAREEKDFFQEHGYHQREGIDRKQIVHFYSPATWLEKFWIAQRARAYRERYPAGDDPHLRGLVNKLKAVNDPSRFQARQEEGLAVRREAVRPVLEELEAAGEAAIAYLLPLTYTFSWTSLFVPDLLKKIATEDAEGLLAELSMFRFPYFAQRCLSHLEALGEKAFPRIAETMRDHRAFDELKVGLILVLGKIQTQESFQLLAELTEHESPYVVNWAAQALAGHKNPEALPVLERARARLGALSKIEGAIKELAAMKEA